MNHSAALMRRCASFSSKVDIDDCIYPVILVMFCLLHFAYSTLLQLLCFLLQLFYGMAVHEAVYYRSIVQTDYVM